MTSKVYRLENENGKGPYTCGFLDSDENMRLLNEMYDYHAKTKRYHPTPEEDNINVPYFSTWVFGFLSMDDLNLWFMRFLPRLLNSGFKIVTYENPQNIIIGSSKRQIAFIP